VGLVDEQLRWSAGATHLVLMLSYPYPNGIIARLANEVVALVG